MTAHGGLLAPMEEEKKKGIFFASFPSAYFPQDGTVDGYSGTTPVASPIEVKRRKKEKPGLVTVKVGGAAPDCFLQPCQ